MIKNLLLISMLLVIIPVAYAGPFGIEIGMSLEEVKKVATIESQSDSYKFMYFIKPNLKSSYISNYRVSISPNYGVFEITLFGKIIESDTYGNRIKEEYNTILGLITKTYGKPSHSFDFLHSDSILNKENEWLKSLKYKERTLSNFWTFKYDNDPYKKINLIVLSIEFLDDYDNICFVKIIYMPYYHQIAYEDAMKNEYLF